MTQHFAHKFSIRPVSISLRPLALLAAAASLLLLFSAAAPTAVAQTPTLIVLHAAPEKVKRGDGYRVQPPLTKDESAEMNKAYAAAIKADPALASEQTALMDKMKALQVQQKALDDKILAAMRSADPDVAPILSAHPGVHPPRPSAPKKEAKATAKAPKSPTKPKTSSTSSTNAPSATPPSSTN